MENQLVQKEFAEPAPVGVMSEIASSRQAQEVQAMVVVAKKFPRDQVKVLDNIKTACTRVELASKAIYTYPRGNETVKGLSIRIVEELARCWGNMVNGVNELERRDGLSVVEAYSWDIESNVRDAKVFEVPHERYTKGKGTVVLTEARDIYELCANYGARRKRACILANIPKDLQDAAMFECEKTLQAKVPVTQERIKNMVDEFAKIGVTKEMVERKLKRPLDMNLSPAVFILLGGILNGILDGMSSVDDHFEAVASKNDVGEVRSKKPEEKKEPDNGPASPETAGTPETGKPADPVQGKQSQREKYLMVLKAVPKSKEKQWGIIQDKYLNDVSLSMPDLEDKHYLDLITLVNNFLVGSK